ncbi:hypothetical protein ACN26A_003614, partial [Vibrio cholerae]
NVRHVHKYRSKRTGVQYLHENKVKNILYNRAVKKNTLNVQILHDNRSHSSHKKKAQYAP